MAAVGSRNGRNSTVKIWKKNAALDSSKYPVKFNHLISENLETVQKIRIRNPRINPFHFWVDFCKNQNPVQKFNGLPTLCSIVLYYPCLSCTIHNSTFLNINEFNFHTVCYKVTHLNLFTWSWQLKIGTQNS